MKIEKIIPLAAGSVTIFNFIFSLVPTFSNSALELPVYFGGAFSAVRVLVGIFLEFPSLYALSAFCAWSLTNSYGRAFNNTMFAIFSSLSAWITVFNIREVMSANSLITSNESIFWFAVLVFLCFLFFNKLINIQVGSRSFNDEAISDDFYSVAIPMYIILWAIGSFVAV